MTARAVAKARKVVRKEKGNMEMLPVPQDIAAELRQVHGGPSHGMGFAGMGLLWLGVRLGS